MVCAKLFGVFFLVVGYCEMANAQNDSAFAKERLSAVSLYDVNDGKSMHLPLSGSNAVFSLFIFLSPECPLSRDYLPLLNSLQSTYSENVRFYGIIPGKAYSAKTIRGFARTYNVGFPLFIDSSKALTEYMHAAVTPEVILLDSQNLLVYKGAVDDLLTGLGKRRLRASHEYLKDAILQCLRNERVVTKRTKAVGCKINDY